LTAASRGIALKRPYFSLVLRGLDVRSVRALVGLDVLELSRLSRSRDDSLVFSLERNTGDELNVPSVQHRDADFSLGHSFDIKREARVGQHDEPVFSGRDEPL